MVQVDLIILTPVIRALVRYKEFVAIGTHSSLQLPRISDRRNSYSYVRSHSHFWRRNFSSMGPTPEPRDPSIRLASIYVSGTPNISGAPINS